MSGGRLVTNIYSIGLFDGVLKQFTGVNISSNLTRRLRNINEDVNNLVGIARVIGGKIIFQKSSLSCLKADK